MARTYSQNHRKDMYPQLSSNIRLVWLNGWVFVYELSDCGFASIWSDLNFRFRVCFEQGLPWHSNNYRVWIHSVMPTWHDQNIQSNSMYREVLTTQLNYLASSAKWLSAGYEQSGFGFESSWSHQIYALILYSATCESLSTIWKNTQISLVFLFILLKSRKNAYYKF